VTTTLLDSLSDGQRNALAAIIKWFKDGGYEPFTLGGLAGTGKTTLAGLFGDVLPAGTRICYAAYTGKAVSVLRSKLPPRIPAEDVSTIHRRLYQPQVTTICLASDLKITGKEATRCPVHLRMPDPCLVRQQISFAQVDEPLAGYSLVVADEASMIPEQLWRDLTRHAVPVLAIGDHGQLPPVRSAFSLMESPDFRLEEIHRQAAGSPILTVARWAREQGYIPHGWHGEKVVKIRPPDLGYVGQQPRDSDMIICAKNATRMYHNAAMRAQFNRGGPPSAGDVVICLRNNYDQGLFNGQRGVVTHVGEPDEIKGEPVIDLVIDLDGLTVPWVGQVSSAQFESAETLATLPRDIALFGFGYALTCHKCTDDTTQILTQSGWKTHSELTVGEQVLTLNPETQLSEWQPVLGIHRYEVDELLLSVEDESHSSLTTLNHRWPVKDYRDRIIFVDSRYLMGKTGRYRAIAKAAPHHGFPDTPKYSDAFVELVAWFWTEGHVLSNRGEKIGAVSIRQSETANPEDVASIRAALLAEYGPSRRLGRYQDTAPGWSESWRHPGGLHQDNPGYRYWRFGLNNAAGRAIQACAPGKVVTLDFIQALTRSQLELFIQISLRADGYTEHAGSRSYSAIRQKSRDALEAFQFACTLAGYSTVIRQTPSSGLWWMRLKTGRFHHPRQTNTQLIRYTGTVWCPETANGTWFAKRNETTYFTGNSQGSQAGSVIVIEEDWPTVDRDRWLYTAVTRAEHTLTVVGW
jgi:AAA domain/UvrD-like helicase C-terminal domain